MLMIENPAKGVRIQQSFIMKDLCPSEALDLFRSKAVAGAEDARLGQRPLVILDVRTPLECSSGRIEGSITLDFRSPSFQDQVLQLDPEKAYLVYCRTGRRSLHAVRLMRSLGFRELYNLVGGIVDWQNEGFEVVKD